MLTSLSQGLRTTEFTNLIGWKRYWERPRFSHLDRLVMFCGEKIQTKMLKYWVLSTNNTYFANCKKPDAKKSKDLEDIIKFSSSPFGSNMSVKQMMYGWCRAVRSARWSWKCPCDRYVTSQCCGFLVDDVQQCDCWHHHLSWIVCV